MKKFLLFMMAAAAVVFAGCSKSVSSLSGTTWVFSYEEDGDYIATYTIQFTDTSSLVYKVVENDGETYSAYGVYTYDSPDIIIYEIDELDGVEVSPRWFGVVEKKTMTLFDNDDPFIYLVFTRK